MHLSGLHDNTGGPKTLGGSNLLLSISCNNCKAELYAAHKASNRGPIAQYVSPVAKKFYRWMKNLILTNQSVNSVMKKEAREFRNLNLQRILALQLTA